MSKPQNGLEKPKLTFIQKCKTMEAHEKDRPERIGKPDQPSGGAGDPPA